MYRYQINLPTMEKSKCNSWIILKVRKVKPDTWKKIVQVQRFLKKEDSIVFLLMDQIHSRLNYATVENFKTVWSYLTFQETALKFMNVIGPFAKELENLLISENVMIGQSSSKCPDFGVCTVNSLCSHLSPSSHLTVTDPDIPMIRKSAKPPTSFEWKKLSPLLRVSTINRELTVALSTLLLSMLSILCTFQGKFFWQKCFLLHSKYTKLL